MAQWQWLLAVLLVVGCARGEGDGVVVRVDGEAIRVDEIRARAADRASATQFAEVLIEHAIADALVMHEAARRGVVLGAAEEGEAVRGMAPRQMLVAQARELGMGVDALVAQRTAGLRAQQMLLVLLAREAPGRFAPTEGELRAWFDGAPEMFAEPVAGAMVGPGPALVPAASALDVPPRFEDVRARVRARWIGRAVMELAPGFLARLRAGAVIERKEGVSV